MMVRVWTDDLEEGQSPTVQGSVTNVMTNKKRYFNGLGDLGAVIEEMMGGGDVKIHSTDTK